jgi:hypothetical protein
MSVIAGDTGTMILAFRDPVRGSIRRSAAAQDYHCCL